MCLVSILNQSGFSYVFGVYSDPIRVQLCVWFLFYSVMCLVSILIQSGFSYVFGVYSEPIEIAWQYHLFFYLSHYPIRDKSLSWD